MVLLVSSDCCDSYDNLTPLLRLKIVDRHIAAKYRFETPFCHRGLCRNDEGRTYAQRCKYLIIIKNSFLVLNKYDWHTEQGDYVCRILQQYLPQQDRTPQTCPASGPQVSFLVLNKYDWHTEQGDYVFWILQQYRTGAGQNTSDLSSWWPSGKLFCWPFLGQ